MRKRKVCVLGAGFSGLAAATTLAAAGYEVDLLERHEQAGGRARRLQAEGFSFDMGPSWYWMPDVMERYFSRFGWQLRDHLDLRRLNPSYRVFFDAGASPWDLPAGVEACAAFFERMEAGAGRQLRRFLAQAAEKYRIGMHSMVYRSGLSLWAYCALPLLWGLLRHAAFRSMRAHVASYFRHPALRQLMEFPVLFLGASPQHTPALYSLMNYADIALGTWYPMKGGIYKLVETMVALAQAKKVRFHYKEEAIALETNDGKHITAIRTASGQRYTPDVVLSGADYAHTESLLPAAARGYSERYWKSRQFAPSCLLYYLGLRGQLKGLLHHNLFFDTPYDAHLTDIYEQPCWPKAPLFYASVTSKTDSTTAPTGCENLFLLVPVAARLEDTPEVRAYYRNHLLARLEQHTGEQDLAARMVYERSYASRDFIADYRACAGNAYGLANTLKQTAVGKPRMRSRRLSNLFFCGHLTNPGPGVPPALVSGQVAAALVSRYYPVDVLS